MHINKGNIKFRLHKADAFVLLLLALAVSLVCVNIVSKPEIVKPVYVPIIIELRAMNTPPFTLKTFNAEDLIGKKLNTKDATVKDCKLQKSLLSAPSSSVDAGFELTVSDTHKDVIITLDAQMVKDSPVIKIANQEVRSGMGFFFKTTDVELKTIVSSIKMLG